MLTVFSFGLTALSAHKSEVMNNVTVVIELNATVFRTGLF